MVHFASHVSPRSIFIAKEGMLRRGTVVGLVVTAGFIVASLGDPTMDFGSWHSIALAVMCFLGWTLGAGWLIGASMWAKREQSARRGGDHRF